MGIDYANVPTISGAINGIRGESAYQAAVRNGFKGTEAEWVESLKGENISKRITPLVDEELTETVIDAIGIPVYVADVSEYEAYGITDTGWYIFARITAKDDVKVTAATTVEGAAGYIATVGEHYIDVAVRFEVAAYAQKVTIDWGTYKDVFVFKATDLAIRNLDYRVTFYVYDADDYATWEYGFATDTAFVADKTYYTEQDGTYTAAEVTASDPVPAYYVVAPVYTLTTDTTFTDGKTYYTLVDGVYTPAEVTVGGEVEADTYYEQTGTTYKQVSGTFEDGVTYYTKSGSEYTAAEVTVGDPIPAYYVHTKVTIEGLIRNVTYRLNQIVDCPMTFILPEIEDETHGCWFEIRCRHAGSYSMTLVPPSSDVKIATEHTQAETKGMNMINLHYSDVSGAKVWRFMNTHSNFTE